MRVAAFGLLLALQATQAQLDRIRWVPNPRVANGTWVADPSRHLRDSTVATLNGEIAALEQATSAEIAVVVVDSTSGLEPFDFALAIHRGWGVGKRGKDNGIVFLWVPAQRAVHISVGYGLEGVLPDRRVGRIRDEQIFSAFRNGAFDEGVLAGVRALAAATREETNARQGITPMLQRGGTGVLGWLLGIAGGGIALIGGAIGYRRWKRRRPRNCTNGHPMRLLDDREEIAKLDKGAQLEQELRSIDWDVWACDTCGETLRVPFPRGSWWGECPQCKRRTVMSVRNTVHEATTTRQGLAQITKTCENCRWTTTKDEVIPIVVVTSNDSSSGDGSSGGGGADFGGGSAGGGGAGGDY
ncbi:MAG: TPM domain-containing protein [Gemmatimonadetes bacterium]|nr:TPM domain-containing protein [Gemmatimonadota bacterium]